MDVILKENVKNLGLEGELVEVADGHARNLLFPRGMAVRTTEANLDRYEKQREQLEEQREKLEADAQELADQLNTLDFELEKNASEEGSLYGSVSQADIGDLLREEGYEQIKNKQVIIEEPIKELGEYSVRVKVFESVEAEVDLEVVPA